MLSKLQLKAAVAGARMLVFDFDGVFTDNAVWVDENGVESVRCSRGDGMGIGLLRKAAPDLLIYVLSTEENPVVGARCRKLKIRAIQGVADKAERLQALASEAACSVKEIAYVGNDINDADCLKICGLPIVVADAHSSVQDLAAWRTEGRGGHGAVREICDCFIEWRGRGSTV